MVTLKLCPDISEDSKTLTIEDVTGVYGVNNLTGWESPNYALSTAATAKITIAKRNADGTFTNSPLSPISVYPTFPSSTFGSIDITAEQAGYGVGSKFDDGIYLITYTVTGNSGGAYTLTTNYYWSNIQAGECCLKKAADKVSLCNNNCERLQENFVELSRLMRLYCSAKACGNLNAIQLFIDKIGRLCSTCGCGC